MSYNCVLELSDPGNADQPNCQDSYISSSAPTTNYGAASSVICSKNAGVGGSPRRPLIRKDLLAAPASGERITSDCLIDSLTFHTFIDAITSRAATVASLTRKITNPAPAGQWEAAGVTWNNYKSGAAWAAAGGDFLSGPVASDNPPPNLTDVGAEWISVELAELGRWAMTHYSGVFDVGLVPPPTGNNAFVFSWYSINAGSSPAQLVATFRKPPVAEAGDNQSITAGATATMAGSKGLYDGQVTWDVGGGDGSFNGTEHDLAAVYTPGAGDIAAGTVELTLLVAGEADGGGGTFQVALDTMTLTINPLTRGYDLWIRGDRAAVVGDPPLSRLSSSLNSVQYTVAGLGLAANTPYWLSLAAFNASGHSEIISKRFVTDGGGVPQLRPSLVKNLRVEAKAGGAAGVTWTYDEPTGIGRADTFSIEVTSLTGGSPIAVDDVAATAAREYRAEISGADGDYRVKVYVKLSGAFEPAVTGVDVRLDSSPPVGTVPDLAAV